MSDKGSYSIEEAKAFLQTIDAYRDIVEGVPVVTYIEADDDLDTALYTSPQIEQVLGFTQEEWNAGPEAWVTHIHPHDRDWVLDDSIRHTSDVGSYRAEYRMLTKDDRTVWIRDESEVVRDETGRPIYWRGVLVDVTELKQAEERLRRSVEMLRTAMSERRMLLRRVQDAAEQERRQIAEDIHDDPVQVMASVSLRLQALHSDLPEDRRATLAEIREMTDHAIERLRHLVFELRPPALDSRGLSAALLQCLERSGAEAGFDFRVEDYLETEPPADLRMQIYRIAQEAIANARKHAGARLVEVTLSSKGSGVLTRIHDDGRGFESEDANEPVPGHLGFSAMRERAEMAGGIWEIKSVPGEGTTVEFWLPAEPPAPPVSGS